MLYKKGIEFLRLPLRGTIVGFPRVLLKESHLSEDLGQSLDAEQVARPRLFKSHLRPSMAQGCILLSLGFRVR